MLFLIYVMIHDLVVMVRFYMGVRLAALWVVWASPPRSLPHDGHGTAFSWRWAMEVGGDLSG